MKYQFSDLQWMVRIAQGMGYSIRVEWLFGQNCRIDFEREKLDAHGARPGFFILEENVTQALNVAVGLLQHKFPDLWEAIDKGADLNRSATGWHSNSQQVTGWKEDMEAAWKQLFYYRLRNEPLDIERIGLVSGIGSDSDLICRWVANLNLDSLLYGIKVENETIRAEKRKEIAEKS